MHKNNNRYEVGLLWKNEDRPQDNRKQAISQAIALRKRLLRDGTLQEYKKVLIDEYLELGAIEEEHSTEQGYYMPHHAVVCSSSSTTKIRAVFNASAPSKNKKSLNDFLSSGPSLLPDLTGLLLRFREFKFAFQADIKKAFFMIAVRPEDRVYLRFVWPNEDDQITVWRLKRVPFGVNCSPFLLNATIQHHLALEQETVTSKTVHRVITLMQNSFYVDDCLSSLSDAKEVDQFQQTSCEIMTSASMELRKWRGNSIVCSDEAGTKVLGITWETELDQMSIAPDTPTEDQRWTRRSLLKFIASIFDPLGYITPFTIAGKILLQQSWKESNDWDAPFAGHLQERTQQWGKI